MGLFWRVADERIVLLEERVADLKAELATARDVATHPLVQTLASTVEYLKGQLEQERELRLAEREEFKRAVDRVVELAGARPIGQNPHERPKAPVPFKLDDLASVFTYEKEPDGQVRKLDPEELR